MFECSWKTYWGIECLTCGFQRSFLQLFEGNFLQSIQTFPATIPFIFTVVFTGIHLKKKFNHGATVILSSFSVTALLIAANYIVKLSNGTAFH